jgi:heat shock protein HslJ
MHHHGFRSAFLLALFTLFAGTAMAQLTLDGTSWRATELAGKRTPKQDPKSEAHLQFQAGRVYGSDGCNRVTGSYQLNGDRVTFGQMAATQIACLNTSGIEVPFRNALKNASRLSVAGDRLELFDAAGTRLAMFVAARPPLASVPSSGLAGTSWQLVKFQSSDDTTLTPDDRANYTIEFAADGQLFARLDCNRGVGTWKSTASGQIEFSPLALTRAQCPAGSLHDQIAQQWCNIRWFVVKDGHLFLGLMADGGIYEFEPVAKGK